MTSKDLKPDHAAKNSASQQHLDQVKKCKPAPRYTPPTKPSHLNNAPARDAQNLSEAQFAKSARSYTPPPDIDTTNWSMTNGVHLMMDYCTPLARDLD